jgi:hypothetical protein
MPDPAWVPGDMLGLSIPAHSDALRIAGESFLTDAFRASGAEIELREPFIATPGEESTLGRHHRSVKPLSVARTRGRLLQARGLPRDQSA